MPPREQHEDKTCVVCGRTISWRKKWARDWPSVKFCSDACRAKRSPANLKAGESLEAEIVSLLETRARGATVCPSDVARKLSADDWRPLMEPIREAARRLVARGVIVITQRNHVVDPSTAKGPIRLKLAP